MTTVANHRSVSNSEAQDFNKCETAWKFKFHPDYKLAPLTDGVAITYGVRGHEALEFFYKKLMDGVAYDDAAKDVADRLISAGMHALTSGDTEKFAMYSDLASRLKEYFEFYRADAEDWEILGIEEKLEVEGVFVGRVDLIVRYKRGPWMGRIAIIDHKFTGNFWKDKAYNTAPQPRIYIWAYEQLHPELKDTKLFFLVNQVRTRTDAIDKFKRMPIEPTRVEKLAFIENHKKVAKKVLELDRLSKEEVDQTATRTFVKTTCEYCNFETLCMAQLVGTDTSTMEMVNFKNSTYGYTSE